MVHGSGAEQAGPDDVLVLQRGARKLVLALAQQQRVAALLAAETPRVSRSTSSEDDSR